jgi:KaiC/GvpD/RAD55 family RecA-like ATPase
MQNEIELYKKLGWKILLLNGKIPIHPNWPTRIVTDEELAMHRGNIGIQTGKVSGIIVVDIDSISWPTWLTGKHLVETIPFVQTGKGRHFYFRYQEGIRNSVKKLGPETDIRSDNGFVVVPPSIHENGNKYEWIISPEVEELVDLPQEIVDKLKENKVSPGPTMHVLGGIREGSRNDTLASLAGTMRSRGFSYEAILAALFAENQAHCSPQLPTSEVETIAKSISRYEPGVPGIPPTVRQAYGRGAMLTETEESHSYGGLISSDIVKWSDLKNMDFEPVETIKTGIPCLDQYLDGGLGVEEVSFFIGEQSVGKTTLSCFIGANAVKQGFNVLHTFYEDRLSSLKNRYGNHLIGPQENEVYFLDATKKVAKIEDIERAIKFYKPGLVIVDYFFRIPSVRGMGDSRFEAKDTVMKLANLARIYKTHILILDHVLVSPINKDNMPWCYKMTFSKVSEAKMYKLGITDIMIGLMRDKNQVYITGMKAKRYSADLFRAVTVDWNTGRYIE